MEQKNEDYFSVFTHSYGQRVRVARWNGGGFAIANKVKLNFRFHNPNTAEETANYILKIFLEANQEKLEGVLQEEADKKDKVESL